MILSLWGDFCQSGFCPVPIDEIINQIKEPSSA
jgi:hypothetical protein